MTNCAPAPRLSSWRDRLDSCAEVPRPCINVFTTIAGCTQVWAMLLLTAPAKRAVNIVRTREQKGWGIYVQVNGYRMCAVGYTEYPPECDRYFNIFNLWFLGFCSCGVPTQRLSALYNIQTSTRAKNGQL